MTANSNDLVQRVDLQVVRSVLLALVGVDDFDIHLQPQITDDQQRRTAGRGQCVMIQNRRRHDGTCAVVNTRSETEHRISKMFGNMTTSRRK